MTKAVDHAWKAVNAMKFEALLMVSFAASKTFGVAMCCLGVGLGALAAYLYARRGL